MEKKSDGISPKRFTDRLKNLPIFSCIRSQETQGICSCDGESEAFPLLSGAMETKKVFDPFGSGERCLSVGSVEIEDEHPILSDQKIFQLKISVVEAVLMELAEEKTCGPNRFPFPEEILSRRLPSNLIKILDQVFGLRNFNREKEGSIKWPGYHLMNGSNRLNRRDPGRSDIFGQHELSDGSRSTKKEVSGEES